MENQLASNRVAAQTSSAPGNEWFRQRIKAILACLEGLGVSVPADTEAIGLGAALDRILAGLMTAEAAKAHIEGKSPKAAPAPVWEEQGISQFSSDDDRVPEISRAQAEKLVNEQAKHLPHMLKK